MDRFRRFMYGRYGGDQLSRALLVLSFILLILVGFLPRSLSILSIIGYIPTIICVYRMFSKDIYKRRQENYKYLKVETSAIKWVKQKLNAVKISKTHKYFNCPDCKQRLRVPRGQGKISITCPKCKKSFKAKS